MSLFRLPPLSLSRQLHVDFPLRFSTYIRPRFSLSLHQLPLVKTIPLFLCFSVACMYVCLFYFYFHRFSPHTFLFFAVRLFRCRTVADTRGPENRGDVLTPF